MSVGSNLTLLAVPRDSGHCSSLVPIAIAALYLYLFLCSTSCGGVSVDVGGTGSSSQEIAIERPGWAAARPDGYIYCEF